MFSFAVGDIELDLQEAVDLLEGTYLEEVLDRGFLRCGVHLGRPGFAMEDESASGGVVGMEIDFCRAVSAGLFGGRVDNLQFVLLSNDDTDGYQKLVEGGVDIFAGGTWSLETDIREASTGVGFSFTQPYFYGYSKERDNLCLVTKQDDHQWKTFVFWIVAAAIHAEENNILQTMGNDMPEARLYGPRLQRMMKDSVLTVGNYDEIYQRNLQSAIPRSGRNRLNDHPHSGPQFYPMPGLIN